jgi:kumamolisin
VVEGYARAHGLDVVGDSSIARRSVALSGSVAAIGAAFGTTLVTYTGRDGASCTGWTGSLEVPAELRPVIQAVLGLDDRPPRLAPKTPATAVGTAAAAELVTSYSPPEVAAMYNFPSRLDGSGQRIAIVEVGPRGYDPHELQTYFNGLDVPMPAITDVSVDGAQNTPGQPGDFELALDVQVVGSIVPRAELLVYFAPNDERGFVDAVTAAVFDEREPSVVSISFGNPEDCLTDWTRMVMDDAFKAAACLGITVCVSSGDHGYSALQGLGDVKVEGVRASVLYPASSPFVLACGGTTLMRTHGGVHESVWGDVDEATGGGVSEYYPLPSWQRDADVPVSENHGHHRGRGVPDVAGNADGKTGYRLHYDGRTHVVGGTSAVAPLWAALVAQVNESLGTSVGYLNPLLYESIAPAGFNAVVRGTNGAYRARLQWDCCTGHGSPDGTRLLHALQALPASEGV